MADWQSIARTTITRALVAFVLVSIGFAAGTHVARQAAPSPAPLSDGDAQAAASHVVVSYMHATFRCATCNTIEQMTRDLLARDFAEELASGMIEFKEVNFQKEKAVGAHYGISASCVVVSQQQKGQETAFKRLDEVWTLMKEPPAFNQHVGDIIRGYLPAGAVQP